MRHSDRPSSGRGPKARRGTGRLLWMPVRLATLVAYAATRLGRALAPWHLGVGRGHEGDDEVAGPIARWVVRLRVLVLLGWVGAAVAMALLLPGTSGGAAVSGLVPDDAPAVRVEQETLDEFGFPLISRTMVVQREPDGLGGGALAASARTAAAASEPALRGRPGRLAYALPVANLPPLDRISRERGTTAVTYLYFRRGVGAEEQLSLAEDYADRLQRTGGSVVGVTGAIPGRLETGNLILDRLGIVEVGSAIVVMMVIGIAFRSVVAPLLVAGVAGLAYVVALHVIGLLGTVLGVPTPEELEPLVVVLLLGVVADYSVFLLTGARHRLLQGRDPRRAAASTLGQYGPVITVAAFTVAAGTAALLVARLDFARSLGPGMAVTVIVALVVTATALPAAIALIGRWALWPAVRGEPSPRARTVSERQESPPWRYRLTRLLVRRRVAAPVVLVCVAALAVGALGLGRSGLGFTFISGLPADSEPLRAQEAATAGFAPGIVAPTTLLVEGPSVGRRDAALARFGALLREEPGVAGVVGPGRLPTDRNLGALVSRDGSAARLLVVLDEDPYGDTAIDDVSALRERLPGLAREAGLGGASVRVGGDTALAAETIDLLRTDLLRVAAVVLVLDLLILVVFLRALVGPLVILASSALAVACALGLAAWVFTGFVGAAAITFYMPLAVAVLLVSLGSDYNVFLAGRIWQDAEDRPLRAAILSAAPSTARAISVAGVALAGSFALLALVPLQSFRSFALAMAAGVLIDTFIVRLLLMPSALALLGRFSGWPGSRARGGGPAEGA